MDWVPVVSSHSATATLQSMLSSMASYTTTTAYVMKWSSCPAITSKVEATPRLLSPFTTTTVPHFFLPFVVNLRLPFTMRRSSFSLLPETAVVSNPCSGPSLMGDCSWPQKRRPFCPLVGARSGTSGASSTKDGSPRKGPSSRGCEK